MIVYHKFSKLHVFLMAPQTSCEHPAQVTRLTGMIRIIPATSSSWPLLSVTSWHSNALMKTLVPSAVYSILIRKEGTSLKPVFFLSVSLFRTCLSEPAPLKLLPYIPLCDIPLYVPPLGSEGIKNLFHVIYLFKVLFFFCTRLVFKNTHFSIL